MKGNLDRRVRSQWTLLLWDIGVVHVTGISPWINFPMEISMATSKRRSKAPMTFDVLNS